jgi:hypothetical protein
VSSSPPQRFSSNSLSDFFFFHSLISYPLSIVNVFVSGGLIYIYLNRSKFPSWAPGIHATLPVVIFFFLSNVYLTVAPYVPPDAGESVYKDLPYYLHCVVAIGVFAVGAIYYICWAIVLPRLGKYTLIKETIVGTDGWSRSVFVRVPEKVISGEQRVIGTETSDAGREHL